MGEIARTENATCTVTAFGQIWMERRFDNGMLGNLIALSMPEAMIIARAIIAYHEAGSIDADAALAMEGG